MPLAPKGVPLLSFPGTAVWAGRAQQSGEGGSSSGLKRGAGTPAAIHSKVWGE